MSAGVELFEEELQKLSSCPLRITWHENKTNYLRAALQRRVLHLHLHRLFLEAPSPVLEALIRFALKGKEEDRAVVRKMAHLFFSNHRAPAVSLNPVGAAYNLKNIFASHEEVYFFQKIEAAIGWSVMPNYRKYRSITFGSYDRVRSQIRINPMLDSLEVPSYFVEFIVYHEMLHAVCLPILTTDGKSRAHTAEFRRREKLFPYFQEAKEWELKSFAYFKKKRQHGRP